MPRVDPVAHRDFTQIGLRVIIRVRLWQRARSTGVPAGAGELRVVGLAEEADGQ